MKKRAMTTKHPYMTSNSASDAVARTKQEKRKEQNRNAQRAFRARAKLSQQGRVSCHLFPAQYPHRSPLKLKWSKQTSRSLLKGIPLKIPQIAAQRNSAKDSQIDEVKAVTHNQL